MGGYIDAPTEESIRLYKLREVSEILNVSVQTLRNWCNEGKIRCIRLPNRHRRIPAEEVERILNGRDTK